MYPYYGMPQRQQIVQVSGENGARAYQMAPESSALLLDETAPLVWLVQTDGAGYKATVKAFSITPYNPPKAEDLEERIKRLEMLLNESNPAEPARTE